MNSSCLRIISLCLICDHLEQVRLNEGYTFGMKRLVRCGVERSMVVLVMVWSGACRGGESAYSAYGRVKFTTRQHRSFLPGD